MAKSYNFPIILIRIYCCVTIYTQYIPSSFVLDAPGDPTCNVRYTLYEEIEIFAQCDSDK